MGYFVSHWIIFWPEGRLCVPVCIASPNELSPRESSLQQTHFWVRTHQPREQISGNYCIKLMILSSGKYFIPCWVSQTLRIISLCCAADKDSQASGMLCYVIQMSLILASILPAFQAEEVTGLYLTAQDRIIHQSRQQLGAPGQDETRLGFLILCILFPYSNCFWNKVTFNNLPCKLPFIACSRSQPWNRFAGKAGSATLSEIS